MNYETYLLILKIAAVMIVGFIGSIIARKFKLPNVSGFLVLGLLLGPSMGLIFKGFEGVITPADNNSLKFLGQIALAFIAFSIGAEFSIKSLKKMGKPVVIMTTFEVLGAVLVVFIGMLFLPKPGDIMPNGYDPFTMENIAFALILASMSAATAPAATLMVMRQYRAYGPLTKAVLPITALDDIYGIVVFGFLISIAQIITSTTSIPVWQMILKPFVEVFGSILIGLIIGGILSLVINKFDKLRDDLQVLAVLTVLLTVGGIEVLNEVIKNSGFIFNQLLANIMIGTMIANMARRPAKTFDAINDFATPFYVIFFVLAGASIDLAILGAQPLILLIAGVYVLARGFGKWSGVAFGAKLAKAEPTVQKYLGFALLPQGGVSIGLLSIVAVTMTGDNIGIYQNVSTVIMLSILVYETFGPLFAKFAISKAGEINGLDRLEELSGLEGIETNDSGGSDENIAIIEGSNNTSELVLVSKTKTKKKKYFHKQKVSEEEVVVSEQSNVSQLVETSEISETIKEED